MTNHIMTVLGLAIMSLAISCIGLTLTTIKLERRIVSLEACVRTQTGDL